MRLFKSEEEKRLEAQRKAEQKRKKEILKEAIAQGSGGKSKSDRGSDGAASAASAPRQRVR